MTFTAPVLEVDQDADAKERSGFLRIKLAILVANLINIGCLVIPGRLDQALGVETWPDVGVAFATPATYAFTIWPVIILTETVFVVWQTFFVKADSSPIRRLEMLRAFAPGWCVGNVGQALWCLTNREFMLSAAWYWLPAVILTCAATGLGLAHGAAMKAEGVEMFLVVPPITLHSAWVLCASVLNWNQWATLLTSSNTWRLTVLGLTLVMALSVAVIITIFRRAPGYACVVAWATIALGVLAVSSEDMAEELGESGALTLGVLELTAGIGLAVFAVCFKVLDIRRAQKATAQ